MTSDEIEKIAVNEIEEVILNADLLYPNINKGDKEPSFDGFVYAYRNNKKTKDCLECRVPVQVKGKIESDQSKREIKYPIEISDLRNYLNEGGVVYFVVYISEDKSKKTIYYTELAPLKIEGILKEAKEAKTKSIKLKRFPNKKDSVEAIFLNYEINKKHQFSFIGNKLFSIEELKNTDRIEEIKIMMPVIGNKPPEDNLYDLDIYLYAKLKGSNIFQPVLETPGVVFANVNKKKDIRVGDKTYYNNIQLYSDSKGMKITRIGNSISITENAEDEDKRAFLFDIVDDLDKALIDLEFFIEFAKKGECYIGELKYLFPGEIDDSKVENYKNTLQRLQDFKTLLKYLNINKQVKIKSLKQDEYNSIYFLKKALVDKSIIHGLNPNLKALTKVVIGDINLMLFFDRFDKKKPDTYRIYDFFTNKIHLTYTDSEKKKYFISQFTCLNKDDFLECDNIVYNNILKSIKEVGTNNINILYTNNLMLELIKAYDVKSNIVYLDAAKKIGKWLKKDSNKQLDEEIIELNLLQIVKRKRKFTKKEIDVLKNIALNGKNNFYKFAAYLLLEDKENYIRLYNRLTNKEKDSFMEFPISKFFGN